MPAQSQLRALSTVAMLLLLITGCDDGGNAIANAEVNNAGRIEIRVASVHDVIQGGSERISIYLDSVTAQEQIAGFSFLLDFDTLALSFIGAEPGAALDDCGWEYFGYLHGDDGKCGSSACPDSKVRITAIADIFNGPNQPHCFLSDASVGAELVRLNFLVTDERTLECQFVPVRWYWYSSEDNSIALVSGEDAQMLRRHYDTIGEELAVHDSGVGRDTPSGVTDDVCAIEFYDGGIDIICADSIDVRPDWPDNPLHGVVLYSNYFVFGPDVFTGVRIEDTDINHDGTPLTLADFMYLVRIVIGDAIPYPFSLLDSVTADYRVDSAGVVAIADSTEMGAVHLIVMGDVTPQLLAGDMEMKYQYDRDFNHTKVLVYSLLGDSFTGDFLAIDALIEYIEMTTVDANPVITTKVE